MASELACFRLYDILETTAVAFVQAIIARPASHQPDYTRLYEVAAPHFRIAFHPRTFADHSPTLRDTYDIEGFCNVVQRMSCQAAGSHLSVQRAIVREVIVDVKKCSVVVRVDYYLHVDGDGEVDFELRDGFEMVSANGATSLNDTVFFLQLTEDGDKIFDVIQYVDPMCMGVVNDMVCRIAGGRQNINTANLF